MFSLALSLCNNDVYWFRTQNGKATTQIRYTHHLPFVLGVQLYPFYRHHRLCRAFQVCFKGGYKNSCVMWVNEWVSVSLFV